MFNRFDPSAREVWTLAGNLAAERKREKLGVQGFVHDVEITVADVKRAHHLICGAAGWQGHGSAALVRRLGNLPDELVSAQDLRDAIR